MRLVLTFVLALCALRTGCQVSLTEYVIDGFDRGAQVIAVGEVHGLETLHAELREMVRDPGFRESCRTVVVEFANSRLQPVLDRYIAGGDVPERELSRVWLDTAVSPFQTWQGPMYRAFFDTVREINQGLPTSQQIRVVAGGTPIDWSVINSSREVEPFLARSASFARIARREIEEGAGPVLLIAGLSHVQRFNPDPTPSTRPDAEGAGELLDEWLGDRYISVGLHCGRGAASASIEHELAANASPVVFLMEGSRWADMPATEVFSDTRRVRSDGSIYNPYDGARLDGMFDAILYLGPVSEHSYPSELLIEDAAADSELERRAALYQPQPAEQAEAQGDMEPDERLTPLSFLTGDWHLRDEYNGQARYLEESWSDVAGNSLVCSVRWLDGAGEIVLVELITVSAENDGVFAHVRQLPTAKMHGRSDEDDTSVRLRLTDLGEHSVTFTQEPGQRRWVHSITWRLVGDDALHATILLTEDGEPLEFEFQAKP